MASNIGSLFKKRKHDPEFLATQVRVRQSLLKTLSRAIKEVQLLYTELGEGGRVGDCRATQRLCTRFENILRHGQKAGWFGQSTSFWPLVQQISRKQAIVYINGLQYAVSGTGKCRAWIRMAVNECSLESYIGVICQNSSLRNQHYEVHAFVRDDNVVEPLQQLLGGLSQINFNITVDTASLELEAVPEALQPPLQLRLPQHMLSNKDKRRKRHRHKPSSRSHDHQVTPIEDSTDDSSSDTLSSEEDEEEDSKDDEDRSTRSGEKGGDGKRTSGQSTSHIIITAGDMKEQFAATGNGESSLVSSSSVNSTGAVDEGVKNGRVEGGRVEDGFEEEKTLEGGRYGGGVESEDVKGEGVEGGVGGEGGVEETGTAGEEEGRDIWWGDENRQVMPTVADVSSPDHDTSQYSDLDNTVGGDEDLEGSEVEEERGRENRELTPGGVALGEELLTKSDNESQNSRSSISPDDTPLHKPTIPCDQEVSSGVPDQNLKNPFDSDVVDEEDLVQTAQHASSDSDPSPEHHSPGHMSPILPLTPPPHSLPHPPPPEDDLVTPTTNNPPLSSFPSLPPHQSHTPHHTAIIITTTTNPFDNSPVSCAEHSPPTTNPFDDPPRPPSDHSPTTNPFDDPHAPCTECSPQTTNPFDDPPVPLAERSPPTSPTSSDFFNSEGTPTSFPHHISLGKEDGEGEGEGPWRGSRTDSLEWSMYMEQTLADEQDGDGTDLLSSLQLDEDYYSAEMGIPELQEAVSHLKRELSSSSSLPPSKQHALRRSIVQLQLKLQNKKEDQENLAPYKEVCGHRFVRQPQQRRVLQGRLCLACHKRVRGLIREWYQCNICQSVCHKKCLSSVINQCTLPREDIEYILEVCPEKGLTAQQFRCVKCNRGFDQSPLVEIRLCDYDGLYYCPDCHSNDTAVIPARVMHNWDFNMRTVCCQCSSLLFHLSSRPLLRVQKVNPLLYIHIQDLGEVEALRRDILQMKKYLVECKIARDLQLLHKLDVFPNFKEDASLLTLHEMVEIQNGSLLPTLKDIHRCFAYHITRDCQVCSKQSHTCTLCSSAEPLYPFGHNISLCPHCSATYHKNCFTEVSSCPKCHRTKTAQ